MLLLSGPFLQINDSDQLSSFSSGVWVLGWKEAFA
jgi:hypothetical protein